MSQTESGQTSSSSPNKEGTTEDHQILPPSDNTQQSELSNPNSVSSNVVSSTGEENKDDKKSTGVEQQESIASHTKNDMEGNLLLILIYLIF